MRLVSNINRFAYPIFGSTLAVAASVAIQAPVLAQEAAPDPAAQTEGRVIYSRDVSYGSAIGPRMPGQPHSVNAGPTDVILASLGAGLEPISDTENASITAGTNSQIGLIESHVALGVDALSSATGAASSQADIGSIQSSATGGAIGAATGAIHGAMGSLRGALGGGQ